MPSFDVVSEVDMEQARNAVENAQRELTTRFDFRGVDASFEWSDKTAKVTAEGDFQIQQMLDILRGTLIKRSIDTSTLEISDPVHSGKTFSSLVTF